MGCIKTLDATTVIRIAAGEVIDRPASVVRELVDNALDASATEIEVSIQEGGIKEIVVSDNGEGMDREDLALCYHNHTTSKIHSVEDLDFLTTLGFRGEALASIASVARLEISSRPREALSGHRLVVVEGREEELSELGMGYGTIVRVLNLFQHIPARKKFLQAPVQEARFVFQELVKKMLVFPECGFRYVVDGKETFRSPVRGSFLERIVDLFGDISSELIPFEFETSSARVMGLLGKPSFLKHQRNMQFFAVNRRVVDWKGFPFVVSQVYGNTIPPRLHPVVFVFVDMDAHDVDVNVHPMKREVRFRRERVFQEELWRGMKEVFHKPFSVSLEGAKTSDVSSEVMTYPELAEEALYAGEARERDYETPFWKKPLEERKPTPPKNFGEVFAELFERTLAFSPLVNFREYRFVGVLFATYILLEKGDEVIFVDQHAAHERIRYEEIQRRRYENAGIQPLLYPLSVEIAPADYEEVVDHLDDFQRLGFDIEPFGGKSVVIQGVPDYLTVEQALDAFEACRVAFEEKRLARPDEVLDEAIKQMACKTAVKAKDMLSAQEVWGLLDRLMQTPNGMSCPHGRPTFLVLQRGELEKLFKRTGF